MNINLYIEQQFWADGTQNSPPAQSPVRCMQALATDFSLKFFDMTSF